MSASKPYLTSVGADPRQVAAALEWAEYLGATFGASGALDSLQYYERLGWIDAAVRRRLVNYLQGLSVAELHHKKYDEPIALDSPLEAVSGTPFAAHARSLEYVAAIAGDNLEEELATLQVARARVADQFDRPARERPSAPSGSVLANADAGRPSVPADDD